nr:mRNA surveillance protein pelota [uncultured bacterium]
MFSPAGVGEVCRPRTDAAGLALASLDVTALDLTALDLTASATSTTLKDDRPGVPSPIVW